MPGVGSFQVLIALAVVFALASLAGLSRQPDAPLAPLETGLRQSLRAPLACPHYRRFVLFAGYWTLSLLVALPFAIPYFLGELRMSFTQVALWQATTALTALVIAPALGKFADRAGYRPLLMLSTLGPGALTPLFWVAASPGNLTPVWLSAVTEAFTMGAITPALFGMALARAPEGERVSFTAILFVGMGAAGLIGGLVSAPLLGAFAGPANPLPGLNAHQALFALSAVMRALAWLWLRGVREEGAWTVRQVIRFALRS